MLDARRNVGEASCSDEWTLVLTCLSSGVMETNRIILAPLCVAAGLSRQHLRCVLGPLSQTSSRIRILTCESMAFSRVVKMWRCVENVPLHWPNACGDPLQGLDDLRRAVMPRCLLQSTTMCIYVRVNHYSASHCLLCTGMMFEYQFSYVQAYRQRYALLQGGVTHHLWAISHISSQNLQIMIRRDATKPHDHISKSLPWDYSNNQKTRINKNKQELTIINNEIPNLFILVRVC